MIPKWNLYALGAFLLFFSPSLWAQVGPAPAQPRRPEAGSPSPDRPNPKTLKTPPYAGLNQERKSHDPLSQNLFSLELVMRYQQVIGISEEQKNAILAESKKAQTEF